MIELQNPSDSWGYASAPERIKTPVDDRGIVEADLLVTNLKNIAPTGIDWTISDRRPDDHHLYWPEAAYSDSEELRRFQRLPINRIRLPRRFHNFLHDFTLPPEIPDQETIKYRIEAYDVATALFKAADTTKIHKLLALKRARMIRTFSGAIGLVPPPTEDKIWEEYLQQQLESQFDGFERAYQRAKEIPPEHLIFDIGRVSTHRDLGNHAPVSNLLRSIAKQGPVNFVPNVIST